MAIERNAAFLCAWLATYLLHSTLLLGAALLATRKLSPRVDRVAELVWRVALVLPVVTSLAQQLSATAIAPLTSGLAIPTYSPQPLDTIRVPSLVWIGVASVWIAGALVGLSILCFARRELYQRIRHRSPLPALRAGEIDSLPGIRSIRVSLVNELSIPVALAGEICLPAWMLNRMNHAELRAVVAHELAHVTRGDAVWRPLAAAIARVFFFQPLNWIAASRLRELSECICDDEAIAATESSIALASALEAVAARASRQSTQLLFAPAMGVGESLTLRRVARILSTANVSAATQLPIGRAGQLGLAVVAAVVVALSVPRMTLPVIAFQRYTITASDGAGPFTLTLEKGRVVGATIGGRVIGAEQLSQRGTMVELVDRNARRLTVTLTPQGGIRWSGRQPVKADR